MMIPDKNYKLLEEKAKEMGANSVRLTPAENIIVENRTTLKCIFGCNGYGVMSAHHLYLLPMNSEIC